MSKSHSILLAALGGTALLLGVAYGLSTRSYKENELAALKARAEASRADLENARATAAEAEAAATEANERAAASAGELDELRTAIPSDGSAVAPGDPMPEGVALALGRPALPEEIAAWDIDVRPDGLGLPEGRGDVETGEVLFTENCAACHGDFGEAVGRWPVLAGGFDSLESERPVKTVGSYWPYLSTVYDYVHRAMPFGNAQSLSPDEVYALTAYILYLNFQVGEDFELSHENFTDIQLPNEPNFFPDDRLELEHAALTGEPCMENCKESVEITARARVIDVTPEEAEIVEASAEPVPVEAAAPGAADPALVAAGEKAFRRCKACHQVGDNAQNRTGPQLNGIVGRTIGDVEGFSYSDSFEDAHEAGEVWTSEALATFLTDPKGAMQGTKMNFAGVKNDEDLAALLAYLAAQGG